jgi:competence protein ComEA
MMKSSSSNSRNSRLFCLALFAVALTLSAWTRSSSGQGKQLPEGPGKAETQKLCSGCHEIERSIAPRQDRAGWEQSVAKMVAFGMKASEAELSTVLDYLVKHYPAEAVPRININKAKAIELESGLSLKRSQAAAVVAYREKNGAFKSLDDLKKVPGVDFTKFEAKKDRLIFEK